MNNKNSINKLLNGNKKFKNIVNEIYKKYNNKITENDIIDNFYDCINESFIYKKNIYRIITNYIDKQKYSVINFTEKHTFTSSQCLSEKNNLKFQAGINNENLSNSIYHYPKLEISGNNIIYPTIEKEVDLFLKFLDSKNNINLIYQMSIMSPVKNNYRKKYQTLEKDLKEKLNINKNRQESPRGVNKLHNGGNNNNKLTLNEVKKSIMSLNSNTNYQSANGLKSKVLQVLKGFDPDTIGVIASIGVQLFNHQKILYQKYVSLTNNKKNEYKKNHTYEGFKKEEKFNLGSMELETKYIPTMEINLLKLKRDQEDEPIEPKKYNFIVLYQEYLKSLKFYPYDVNQYKNENKANRQERVMNALNELVSQVNPNAISGGNKSKFQTLKQKHKKEMDKLKNKQKNELLKLKNKQKKELETKSSNKCNNCKKNFSSKVSLTNHKKKCN